jgi:DNA-binding MarR family transcriptional regulator
MVTGLEERGLVMRSPDPKDGRRVLLSVSEPELEALWDKPASKVLPVGNPAALRRLAMDER